MPQDDEKQVPLAFDPERFRQDGHALIDRLADHLSASSRADRGPIAAWPTPDEALATWTADFSAEGGGDLGPLVERILAGAVHQHNPRYLGYQISAALPVASLADLLASVLNNGMASFDSGPASTAMECSVVRWLASRLGFPDSADGVLTSGGTIGNLTALLAARRAAGEPSAAARPAVVCSDQTHYCIARACEVMGWGADAAIRAPGDAMLRLTAPAAATTIDAARRDGRTVVALVATAGSTSTGAFDPLGELADLCARRDLWLHVDGAHGASAALSRKYRPLVAGIERADSVVWDSHKLMSLPALVTAVLFREARHSYAIFSQTADYLFAGKSPAEEWYNLSLRKLECTQRMMSVPLYVALSVLGTDFFDAFVTGRFEQTERFAARLADAPDFEVPYAPSSNILCFRHLAEAPADLDRHQERIRDALHRAGRFFISRTRLSGKTYLRTTLMNPHTDDRVLAELIDAVRAAAAVAP